MSDDTARILNDLVRMLEHSYAQHEMLARSVPNLHYAEGLLDGLQTAIAHAKALRELETQVSERTTRSGQSHE